VVSLVGGAEVRNEDELMVERIEEKEQ